MPSYTRNNAWNLGGTFENPDLLWYARAVAVMQAKPIAKPTSWWFYAAIHGELLLPKSQYGPPVPPQPDARYLNWKNVKYIPQVAEIGTMPPAKVTNIFWDQCQHGTWFFPPWHRGYLVAIENILRAIIIAKGGPANWALPYWNYLNQANAGSQSQILPAFTTQHMPDGSANPLYVAERYASKIDVGDIENSANDQCQWDTIYEEGSVNHPDDKPGYFYGGDVTGFSYHGYSERGDLEDNPHNMVHGMIGGTDQTTGHDGIMGHPPTAALDPIFYLHHANIDRMWAAWDANPKNTNPTDPRWLTGPAAQGNSRFVMPLDDNGTAWYYQPLDMQTTANLKYNGAVYVYDYDDLSLTSYNNDPPTQTRPTLLERFANLEVTGPADTIKIRKKPKKELVGASKGLITIADSEISTNVRLDAAAWKAVSNSLLEASFSSIPDQVFLQLEGVKGGSDTNFLSVYIDQQFVRSVSLFGLLDASITGRGHGGAGLSFKINITSIIDNLHLNGNMDLDALNVQVKIKNKLPKGSAITIDRIGLYRLTQ